jgi:hypothetical protein
MIIDTSIHDITLPITPGDTVRGFAFTTGSVDVVTYDVDSICIADAGDQVAHVRVYLRSNQHWLRSQDVDIFAYNDSCMICSELGLVFFNEGNARQKIVDWKTADFTIPA